MNNHQVKSVELLTLSVQLKNAAENRQWQTLEELGPMFERKVADFLKGVTFRDKPLIDQLTDAQNQLIQIISEQQAALKVERNQEQKNFRSVHKYLESR
ncbi:hypothetical protein [Hydrogenovibrio halophilus]|uniref:hypothetical protein n=1 Tax=Hydrogenovibrio halophilus TaxID=373391 RepID=UPI0003676DB9|nr:hypothetical protein [Hydrogenovibrio halophilus]